MSFREQLQIRKAKLIKKIADIENKDVLTRMEMAILRNSHASLRAIDKEIQNNA